MIDMPNEERIDRLSARVIELMREVDDLRAQLANSRKAEEIRWQRVNEEPFEYAIQQGPNGDEFVKLLNGKCLRRAALSFSYEHREPTDALGQTASEVYSPEVLEAMTRAPDEEGEK